MKKVLAIVGLIALVFTMGCDNAASSGGEDTTPTVDVGTSADIPASGADSTPTDFATSQTILTDAMSAVIYGMESSSGSAASARPSARAVESYSEPITWISDDGTVNITGSMDSTVTYPDDNWAPTANTTYNDIMSMVYAITVTGTLAEAELSSPDSGYTYTISGKIGEYMSMNFNLDLKVGSDLQSGSDATANMDLALILKYGLALAIARNDGVGARFFIDYSGSAGFTDQTIDVNTAMGDGLDMQSVVDELTNNTATLTVLDDDGNVLFTEELTLDELPGDLPMDDSDA